MPFFFYSQIDSDVAAQKNQDRAAIIQAAQGVALSMDDRRKLNDFLESVEELYHLYNREYTKPARGLNQTLHNLSIEAKTKIEIKRERNHQTRDLADELNFLGDLLHLNMNDFGLKNEYIKGGIITAIALSGCFASVVLFPGSIGLYLALDVLLLAVSSFTALFFGEKSVDTYRLAHDCQLKSIQSFFGPESSLDTLYIEPVDNAQEIII
tara:strand:+ start:66114 stop:66743 length:630 start_codon:yes stop_codon:yes gene_type:complete